MFTLIKEMVPILLASTVSVSNHIKCISVSN